MATARSKAKTIKKTKTKTVRLPGIDQRKLRVVIEGNSSLVCNNWGEKMRKLLEHQEGQPKAKKGPKDVEREYKNALYPMKRGKFGFPAAGLKKTAVSACRFLDRSIKMTEMRGAFFVLAQEDGLVAIQGKPNSRIDPVRNANGNADIRVRAEFREWIIGFTIEYNANAVSIDTILALYEAAGFGIGIGENRPEKQGGEWGRFHIIEVKEIK